MKWLPLIIVTFLTLWISIQIFQSNDDAGPKVSFTVAGDCPNPALDALVALYNSTDGDNWNNNSGWLDTCDVCQWFGVNCTGTGLVNAVDLRNNNLSGALPSQLGELTTLSTLRLDNNNLSGEIPTELGNIPFLFFFTAGSNQLSGEIPNSFSQLSNLTFLHLEDNELEGPIPTDLGLGTRLRSLVLHHNKLSGLIPSSLGELNTLDFLNLAFNELSGPIPPSLGMVSSLSFFSASWNEITGTIPPELAGCISLSNLDLRGNQIEGSIPPTLHQLQNLYTLDLSFNELSGALSPDLGLFENINKLDISYNYLEGCLPTTFSNYCGSIDLDYSNNPCFYQGSFEDFCATGACIFDDFVLSAMPGNQICLGQEVTLSVDEGSNFQWNTGSSSQSITVSPEVASTYSVEFLTAAGCFRNASIEILVSSPPEIVLSGTAVTISGGSDGSISTSTSGGIPPYSYQWHSGETTMNLENIPSAYYYVTVTDAVGCSDSSSIYISQPACLPAGIPCDDNNPSTFDDTEDGNCNCIGIPCPALQINRDITEISCHGETDGFAISNPSGGAIPYTYAWSNGATSDNITDLGEGTYELTVTDNNGCSVDTTFTLIEPSILTATFTVSDESFPGAGDGSINLETQGGTAPYSILWSNGETSEELMNLPEGLYEVTITDFRGCQYLASTTVNTGCFPIGTSCDDNNPSTFDDAEDGNCNCIGIPCPAIQINLDITEISCHGETDGFAISNPFGGAIPYTYAWSNGATSGNTTDLEEGTYSLTVTDNNGCSTDTTFVLTSPEMLSGSVAITDESLPGAGNGSIDLTVQGGTEPYSFTWSTGDTTEDLSDVSGGNYELTVTDHRGCQLVLSATVNTGCPELIARIVTTDLACPDDNDGSASIIFTGDGVSPHTRIWSTGSTAHSLNNLPKGLYSVTVTDAIGCSSSMNFEIKAPDSIQLQFNTREESSPGAGDGSIDLTILGGTPPFEFEWSDGQDTEDIENLQGQGTEYQVTVTDANACTVSGSVTLLTGCLPEGTNCNDNNPSTYNDQEDGNCQCVGIPCSDIAFNATMADPSCSGDPSGSIFISDVFGEGPFTFSWSNGVTTQNNINIAAGQYSLTITDVNGCQVDTSFSLLEPPRLSVEVMITHPSSPTSMDGEIQAVISGGSGDLAILWSTGDTGTVVSNLPAAVYSLQIEDELGCQLRDTVVLFSECIEGTPCDDGDANTHSDMLDADCNCLGIPCQEIPVQFQVTPPSCWDAANGSIALSIEEKVLVEWSTGDTTSSISNLSEGLYSVTITNEDGCQQEEVFSMTQPSPLIAMITFDSVSQEAMVAMSGGKSPYEVIWSTGSNQTVVPIGNEPIIFVDVQDVNGCFASDTLYLENDEGCNFFLDEIQPLLDISVGPSNPCGQGGAISFGSSFPDDYRFSIDGGQTYHITPLFESLSSGSYQLLISSSTSDCSFDAGEIEIGSEILEDWIGSNNVSPCGESGRIFSNLDDLQISLQTDGIWVDAIDNLSAGSYAVYGKFISDTCVFPITDLIITNFDTSDVIEFIYQDANQCIGTSGSIEILHLEVGYSYSLTNGSIWQEQPRIYEVSPGTYTLMVRTPSGQCEFTLDEQIEVEEIPSLEIENITAQRALACDPENGSITIHTNVPLSTDIEFSVDGGENWQSQSKIQNLKEGPYLVIARTIGSDCADSVEIAINPPIEASTIDVAVQDPNNCEDSNGSITIDQLDADLEFRLNNGIWQSDNIFDSLSSGYFQIELRSQDSAACFLSSDSIKLMNESVPQIGDVLIHEPTECGALASIEVQTLSINAEFSLDSIFWQSDPLFDNVEDGIYTLYIRNGDETCSQFWDSPIEVALPSHANLQAIQIQNASTCEVADGAIFLQDDGFEYSLDSARTFETVDRFDELSPGNYQLIAKSMETGCLDSLEFQIKGDETSLKPDTVIALDPTCYGGTDGYLEIQFEGNTTVDYQYQWDNGGQANFQGTLPAGNYTLSVTTAPNCVQEFAFELNEPQPIEFEVPVLDSVMICLGEKLPITLTDSTLEYYWYLNNTLVNQGPSFGIAEDGDYLITGVNDIGCETSIPLQVDFSTQVFQANFLVPSMVVAGSPLQAIEISWPIPDFIQWQIEGGEIINTAQNIATLQFDQPGEYPVRLYAENGICMTTLEKMVTVVADSSQLDPGTIPQLSHIVDIQLFPNPNNGIFSVDISLREVADIQLRIYNEQSQLIFSDQTLQTDQWNRPVDLQGLPPGIYTLLVQSLDEWRSVGFVIN